MISSACSNTPRPTRLKRRHEFLRVQRQGRKWAAPGLVLQGWRRQGPHTSSCGEESRVGFTVSRKVGNAVHRNRAKRRLRAVADAVLPMTDCVGMDLVLIGRAATVTRSFDHLVGDLETALKKIGVGQTNA